MAAPDNAKLQANFKLNDGTLINVYAATSEEFEASLTFLQDAAELIKSTGTALNGSSAASAAAVLQAGLGATPMAAPASPAGTESAPTCRHGAMTFRSGVGAKGPWKGWMCASPKGSVDKCETVWVK
jgi:hypothetical protein